MRMTLPRDVVDKCTARLRDTNVMIQRRFCGEPSARQPVHTVYGGAHLFKSDTIPKLGRLALKVLNTYAPDAKTMGRALDLPLKKNLQETIYQRVCQKLQNEAVEDFRIDFEDGFGNRANEEEDKVAVLSASELAKAISDACMSPFCGIRIKPLTEDLKSRSIRTLDIFVTTLVDATNGQIPERFTVTLPKVTTTDQISTLVDIFDILENRLGIEPGTLKMEIMVETTQALFTGGGYAALPLMVRAGKERIIGAHFGTYDYTAANAITAAHQSMDHPSCDFARHMMKATLSERPIWLSDGATNIMPVGPHKGDKLSDKQKKENARVVHHAWNTSFRHITHSLVSGYYQGWDLHPAQLPIRYAACYTFFLESLDMATRRLKAFMAKAAQATLVDDIFDDAATGQGLLNYFLRALNCGAISEAEITATGLTIAEVRCRSFSQILQKRRNDGRKATAGS